MGTLGGQMRVLMAHPPWGFLSTLSPHGELVRMSVSQRTCLYVVIPGDGPSGSLFTLTLTLVWKFHKVLPWPFDPCRCFSQSRRLVLCSSLETQTCGFSSCRAHQALLLPPAGRPHALVSSQRVSTTQLPLLGVKVASIKVMFQSLGETSSSWGGLGSRVEHWCVVLIRDLSTDGNVPPVDLSPVE